MISPYKKFKEKFGNVESIARKKVSAEFAEATESGWYPENLAEAAKFGFGEDYLIEEAREILNASSAAAAAETIVVKNRFEQEALAHRKKFGLEITPEIIQNLAKARKAEHQMEVAARLFGYTSFAKLREKCSVQYGNENIAVKHGYILFGGGQDSHGKEARKKLDLYGEITMVSQGASFV